MASPAPTRRVLGDLSLNTPMKARADPRSNTDNLVKPHKMGDRVSPFRALSEEHAAKKVTEIGGEKRPLDKAAREAHESPKRARREAGDGYWVRVEEGESVLERSKVVRKRYAQCDGADDHSPSSRQTSPGSSSNSSQAALDDSQHTILTEPDDVVPAAAINLNPTSNTVTSNNSQSLTRDQIRQKAKAGMLRLRLAGYKVRTNQIHVPMAQLQIHSSSHPAFASFASSYAAPSNRHHLQIVSTPPRGPIIHLREPSSPKIEEQTTRIPSSPPNAYNNFPEDSVKRAPTPPQEEQGVNNTLDHGLATPLLPRQSEGLLSLPGLGSQTLDTHGNELMSSVVKGRAADGLLSLMGRKE
ncbi:uncharacterized protein BP5553_00533 [Venustampulla echinocandica]|uniref:Uncharacterized protein n=1 Tax=Venustampulla echinocandica TaxID=2656787 RepID=A0A370TYG6_9HELO|nr:uncharacterized protein BP5553_00533 [Venustampulla echinocandica]RDL40554.1 hypothetical protein BP5553_00533 [Venustampulla echinocandica]